MSVIYFKISGVNAIGVDATNDETTDAYPFCNSYDWAVSLNSDSIVGGPPTYTIEVSNNGVKWYEFNSNSTDVDVDDAVDSDYMSWKYMRIVYSANGTSSGTIDFELSLNNDKPSIK